MSTKLHKQNGNKLLLWLVWVLEGVVVGFGAILPGISGGTLCTAFGMYRPLIETFTHPKSGLKKYGIMLIIFVIGVAIGFVGLSGLTLWLLGKNQTLVMCAFIGFIMGTFPELWGDAGEQGRGKSSYIAMAVCFLVMTCILVVVMPEDISGQSLLGQINTSISGAFSLNIPQNFLGWVVCGVFWGLSFIVPGLSSSSMLYFFGLYEPMLAGITSFNFGVLIPMAIGMGATILLLSRAVNKAFEKQFSIISHALLGIVAATVLVILPKWMGIGQSLINLLFIVGGFVVSWWFTVLCAKIKAKNDREG